MPSTQPKTTAAILLAMCALLNAGIWVVYLFVSNPAKVTAFDNLIYALSDDGNEQRGNFRWLAIFLFASAGASVAYLGPLSRAKVGALALLFISLCQALAAVAVLPLRGAVIFLAPLPWCYLCWKRA